MLIQSGFTMRNYDPLFLADAHASKPGMIYYLQRNGGAFHRPQKI